MPNPGYLSGTLFVFSLISMAPDAGAGCAAVEEVRLLDYPGTIQSLVPWAGIEQGIFERHCLKAVMIPFPSAPTAFAASIQGSLDFVMTTPETAFIPMDQGLSIKLVAAVNSTIHYALVTRRDLDLPRLGEGFPAVMNDLVGKRIGVNSLGSATDQFARGNFQAAGIDPAQATWVAYGTVAAGIAALQNSTLDAAEFYGDGMDVAAAVVGGKIIGDLRDPEAKTLPSITALRGISVLWTASSKLIESKPDTVRQFIQANNEAVDWVKDPKNRKEVIDIVSRRLPAPEELTNPQKLLDERVARYIPQLITKASCRSLEAWSSRAVAEGRISRAVDIDTAVWNEAREMLVP